MRLVIATPLYPPDIAQPAPYVKELAQRLASKHEVTVIAYAYLPEQVDGVRIIVVNKRRPVLLRLLSFTWALVRAARDADVVIVENGASTELAAGIAARITGTPFILHLGDAAAHERAQQIPRARAFESFLASRTVRVIADTPPVKPEVLPFSPLPDEEHARYEAWWDTHVASLIATITYVA